MTMFVEVRHDGTDAVTMGTVSEIVINGVSDLPSEPVQLY